MDLNSTGRDVSSGLTTNHKVVGGGSDRSSFLLLSKVSGAGDPWVVAKFPTSYQKVGGVHVNPLSWTLRGLFYYVENLGQGFG